MATEHRNIPDAERHEPKGVSTATVGQIYRSNGSASGAWKDDVIVLSGVLTDVSEVGFVLIPVPVNITILSIKLVLKNLITVADSAITITRGGDAAPIASMVVPFTGSVEGLTVVNNSPTNPNVASSNNYIKVASDGGSSSAAPLYISIKAKVTE